MRVISKALRNSAKGRNCTLRLDGCLFSSETVVLAHLPCGHKGVGMKSPDQMAVFACQCCHTTLDGDQRNEILSSDLLRALAETQMYWIEQGLMTIKGVA